MYYNGVELVIDQGPTANWADWIAKLYDAMQAKARYYYAG